MQRDLFRQHYIQQHTLKLQHIFIMIFLGKCSAIFILATMIHSILRPTVAESTLSCTDVFSDLRPCVAYIQFGSGMPPAACCTGVSTLASATKSTEDKRSVCECLKSATQKSNGDIQLAEELPKNCGISNLPFEISPTVDCSKIIKVRGRALRELEPNNPEMRRCSPLPCALSCFVPG